MNKYKFTLPIGDWSNDGHGRCDYFTVESNKSVDEVRDIHFKMKDVTGIDIGVICKRYEESTMNIETYDALIAIGYPAYEDVVRNDDGSVFMTTGMMADLWVWLLMKTDPTLTLMMIDDIPMLPFYGYKDGRHISFIGYGCFD